jgi:hypothetical protein
MEAAAKHLTGDQSACQNAIAFVERVATALPDAELKRLTFERHQKEAVERERKEALQEALKQHKEAEAKRKAEEEIAICKADIADATQREATAAPNAAGPWIGLKALVIKCAPLARMDPSELIARLEARIKAQ